VIDWLKLALSILAPAVATAVVTAAVMTTVVVMTMVVVVVAVVPVVPVMMVMPVPVGRVVVRAVADIHVATERLAPAPAGAGAIVDVVVVAVVPVMAMVVVVMTVVVMAAVVVVMTTAVVAAVAAGCRRRRRQSDEGRSDESGDCSALEHWETSFGFGCEWSIGFSVCGPSVPLVAARSARVQCLRRCNPDLSVFIDIYRRSSTPFALPAAAHISLRRSAGMRICIARRFGSRAHWSGRAFVATDRHGPGDGPPIDFREAFVHAAFIGRLRAGGTGRAIRCVATDARSAAPFDRRSIWVSSSL